MKNINTAAKMTICLVVLISSLSFAQDRTEKIIKTVLSFDIQINRSFEETIQQVTEALKPQGFGVLTRIDMHKAFQRKGLAWQQELHWKEIEDRNEKATRTLWGGYAQLGYFFHELWPAIPAPLEVAGRFGLVDPDTSLDSNLQQEWTFGANWFFTGHRNKLTADVSQILLDAPDGEQSETRVRAQWDVSF
jgi:hypothetical protein